MFIVYILFSASKKRYYIGHTENLAQRQKRHNSGLVRSTKNGIPWTVIYSEEYSIKSEAYRRELQMKAYKGGEAFKKLVDKKRSGVGTKVVNWDRL